MTLSCNHQAALVTWMPSLDEQSQLFSIYRVDRAIELHPGCTERESARLICTQDSYEEAYAFCQILAQETGLCVKDFTPEVIL